MMPIYEYACGDCRRQVSLLILNIHNPPPLRCSHCGGPRLERLLSRFARVRSEAERLEHLADPSRLGDLDERDPQSVRQWMSRMGKELGEDVGEDFESAMEEDLAEEAGSEPSD
jgi:putative FmdB family regulatory protein